VIPRLTQSESPRRRAHPAGQGEAPVMGRAFLGVPRAGVARSAAAGGRARRRAHPDNHAGAILASSADGRPRRHAATMARSWRPTQRESAVVAKRSEAPLDRSRGDRPGVPSPGRRGKQTFAGRPRGGARARGNSNRGDWRRAQGFRLAIACNKAYALVSGRPERAEG